MTRGNVPSSDEYERLDGPLAVVTQARLSIVPIYWKEAKEYVARVHRHHLPGGNGRFCIGVTDEDGELHGVAVMGRPKARMIPHKEVLEVTRVATDETPNACSALYGAACRIHKPHGYRKAITYILESEPGTSLRAAGWKPVAFTDGGTWSRLNRGRDDKHPLDRKVRWECRCSELPDIEPRKCSDCDGRGWLPNDDIEDGRMTGRDSCPTCKGLGLVSRTEVAA